MVCSLFMLMLKFKMMDELDFICMPWLLRNQEIRGIVFYSRHIFSLIFLHCIPGFSTQVTHWGTKREILCDELHITLRQRAFTLFSFFKINVAFLNQYQVNDNQKTTHTQMTGPPGESNACFFSKNSCFILCNLLLEQQSAKWYAYTHG